MFALLIVFETDDKNAKFIDLVKQYMSLNRR